MRNLFFLSILLLIATPSAFADVIDIQWSGDGRFAHSQAIAAGKFVEVCGKIPGGVKVNWEFEASSQVDFNVHYHVAKEVIFPSKLTAVAAANDTLLTKTEEDYCWMWTNRSAAAAKLSVRLER